MEGMEGIYDDRKQTKKWKEGQQAQGKESN